jgi:hypothetical protein
MANARIIAVKNYRAINPVLNGMIINPALERE